MMSVLSGLALSMLPYRGLDVPASTTTGLASIYAAEWFAYILNEPCYSLLVAAQHAVDTFFSLPSPLQLLVRLLSLRLQVPLRQQLPVQRVSIQHPCTRLSTLFLLHYRYLT